MGARYTVHGKTQQECQQALDDLCRLLGAVPTTRPIDPAGRGWIARAVLETTEAPDHQVRGSVMQ
ncbi:hypothetical protein ACGFZA_07755 [Streptomyces sp. NPDC048211]|uniref:hypothetical protein n=1 Tax=Streptomyces sp. NPDC048211 TaxID=3365516 RepID=UPI003722B974